MQLLEAATQGFTTVLGWIGTFIKALVEGPGDGGTGADLTAFLPLIGVSIAISVVGVCLRFTHSATWGW